MKAPSVQKIQWSSREKAFWTLSVALWVQFGNRLLPRQPIQRELPYPFPYFTGQLLQNAECRELKYQDQEASLTVSCAYKEDEGFYTIRIPSLDGYKEQTTYVFVRGISKFLLHLEQRLLHQYLSIREFTTSYTRKYLAILSMHTTIKMAKVRFR